MCFFQSLANAGEAVKNARAEATALQGVTALAEIAHQPGGPEVCLAAGALDALAKALALAPLRIAAARALRDISETLAAGLPAPISAAWQWVGEAAGRTIANAAVNKALEEALKLAIRVSRNDSTTVFIAAQNGRVEVLALLRDCGANLAPDNVSVSPA